MVDKKRLTDKTFKREYAFMMLGILVHQIYTGNTEMVENIVWPIMSFVATSAGLHIYGRGTVNTDQSNDGGS